MPFNITDQAEMTLLTEYLIDDTDQEEKVTEESEQSVIVIRSIFLKLLGNYEPKTLLEYEKCNEYILTVGLKILGLK